MPEPGPSPNQPAQFTNYEAFLPGADPETPETAEQEVNEHNVTERLAAVQQRVTDIMEAHEVAATGHSSFYDVTGNLLGVAQSALRSWELDRASQDPDIHEEASECRDEAIHDVDLLERYLALVGSDKTILNGELTNRDGAFPNLRQQADTLAKERLLPGGRPIPHYVESIEKVVRQRADQADA